MLLPVGPPFRLLFSWLRRCSEPPWRSFATTIGMALVFPIVAISQNAYVFPSVALNVPGAPHTVARGINNAGQVVGEFDDDTTSHGFIYSDGSFLPLDLGVSTGPYAINDTGDIVGYLSNSPQGIHGFIY